MNRTIYLTADHGGYDLKNSLLEYLKQQGLNIVDLGPNIRDDNDDYPDYVLELVKHLRQDDLGLGVVACRSAQGVAIAANRNPGLRAAVVWNKEEARLSRQHNNANILCLSGDHVSVEDNKQIVDAWLEAAFSDEPRHARRLQKIESYFPL